MNHLKKYFILYLILAVFAVISLAPFVIVFVNSTRSDTELLRKFYLIPGSSLFENWRIMQTRIDFFRAFLSSCIISVPGALLSCYFGSMCGYSLSKIKFPGSRIVFSIVLLTLIIPWQIGLIGFFDLMSKYRLLDTYWPLIIPAIGNPQMVFFTKQYIESALHDELIEAARVEGAGELMIFHKLVLPIASPAILTMGLLIFVQLWNKYLTPYIILISNEKFPIPVAIGLLTSPTEVHPGAISLALALSVGVVVIAFLSLSKYLFRAMNMGAVKG